MHEVLTFLGGVAAAGITAGGSVWVAHTSRAADRRKAEAEAAAIISDRWRDYADRMDERVDELEAKLNAMGSRVSEAEARERLLLRDLRKVYEWIETGQRHAPPPRPGYLKG
ncbi:hypothetical protein [Leucobacter sp. OH1287]|uniref:hypothetical protein n=1 Tax=Leucobacter sp. OH1287 TaxID=2491049 RepID=UPI000F5EE4FB|nr:hypothetical protein [Leucobacter sp. OH1287]RRD61619.1 hypothetical protein EII30_01985 [Leucobacter sp. OH1287]